MGNFSSILVAMYDFAKILAQTKKKLEKQPCIIAYLLPKKDPKKITLQSNGSQEDGG